MQTLGLLALSFLLAIPVHQLPAESGQKPETNYKQTGSLALGLINGNWESVWARCQIYFGPARPGYLAAADPEAKRIYVWVRPGYSPEQIASTIAHELAHMFDFLYLTPKQRGQWYKIRNIPPQTPWYPACDMCSDYRFGAGDFAECVRWTIQGKSARFKSKLGSPPTAEQQALIRSWLSSVEEAAKK